METSHFNLGKAWNKKRYDEIRADIEKLLARLNSKKYKKRPDSWYYKNQPNIKK